MAPNVGPGKKSLILEWNESTLSIQIIPSLETQWKEPRLLFLWVWYLTCTRRTYAKWMIIWHLLDRIVMKKEIEESLSADDTLHCFTVMCWYYSVVNTITPPVPHCVYKENSLKYICNEWGMILRYTENKKPPCSFMNMALIWSRVHGIIKQGLK